MLNVDPEKQADAFYRYKMPRVQIKVEGNGNGIKTVIVNVIDISERLARNVEYLMRFFAHELAATTKLKDDKWILTGNHTQEAIQRYIFDFIKRFVLCKSCRNPETVIRVDAKKNIFLDCKACSRTTDIAPTEKLCNAITKLEKPMVEKVDKVIAEANAAKEKKSKKEKGEKKEKKEKSKDEKEEENLDKATRQIREGDDTILTEEVDRPNPVHVLSEFVNAVPPPAIDDFVSKVLDLKEDYGLTEDKYVVKLVFEALFDQNIVQQFSERHRLMKRFVKVDVEKEVISSLMFLCAESESLKSKFHILLKKFYDADIITDESILSWFEKKKAPKGLEKEDFALFKKKSTPFVEWLQQSDESSDEESSEEESVKAPARSPASPLSPADNKPAAAAAANDDDDDIDIDAI